MLHVADIKHQKTMLFLLGVLGAFGFAPVYAWPLFVFSLTVAFLAADEAENLKQAAIRGYVFGFGFFGAGFYWIGNALLIDILSFGWLYPIVLSASGAFFGLFWVVPFVFWRYLDKNRPWAKVLGFASVFVLCEYLRSFLLTGFPWNMLGSMFGFSLILLQTASVFGVYGLSFLVLLITGAVYAFIQKRKKSACFVIGVVLALMTGFGFWRLKNIETTDSQIKVRLVQPSIAQSLKWDRAALEDNLNTYIQMSRQDGLKDVNLVVWGETATIFNPEESIYYRNLIRQAVPENGYLATGLLRYDEKNGALYNSFSVIDRFGQTVAFYDKNHLVPFGEYIPFRKYLPSWVRPVANQIADFSRGEKFKVLSVNGLPPFGALICYEVIFPDEIINRQNKPAFIVLVSNDGWYGQSFGPYQHFEAARMRAVEEGITIIRSANNGISAVISPIGAVKGRIGLNVKGIQDAYLPKKTGVETIYGRIGGKGVQCLMLLIVLIVLIRNKHKINQ